MGLNDWVYGDFFYLFSSPQTRKYAVGGTRIVGEKNRIADVLFHIRTFLTLRIQFLNSLRQPAMIFARFIRIDRYGFLHFSRQREKFLRYLEKLLD